MKDEIKNDLVNIGIMLMVVLVLFLIIIIQSFDCMGQSVTYDYAFTYIDTRVAFFDYYDPNGIKYETRAGIPLNMTDPNEIEAYLSTPDMLELILVNIRHTEYPNLPVMETAAEMFDQNNWCDMPPCDPNELPGDPNFYLLYVSYPANYNPNYNQTIAAIEADESISPAIQLVIKKLTKAAVKQSAFE